MNNIKNILKTLLIFTGINIIFLIILYFIGFLPSSPIPQSIFGLILLCLSVGYFERFLSDIFDALGRNDKFTLAHIVLFFSFMVIFIGCMPIGLAIILSLFIYKNRLISTIISIQNHR